MSTRRTPGSFAQSLATAGTARRAAGRRRDRRAGPRARARREPARAPARRATPRTCWAAGLQDSAAARGSPSCANWKSPSRSSARRLRVSDAGPDEELQGGAVQDRRRPRRARSRRSPERRRASRSDRRELAAQRDGGGLVALTRPGAGHAKGHLVTVATRSDGRARTTAARTSPSSIFALDGDNRLGRLAIRGALGQDALPRVDRRPGDHRARRAGSRRSCASAADLRSGVAAWASAAS